MIPQWVKNKNKGYIVESGSNANGEYIKFSDGIMICKGKKKFIDVAITAVWGNFYTSGDNILVFDDFAQDFSEIPIVTVAPVSYDGSGGNFFVITNLNKSVSKKNAGGFQVGRGTSSTQTVILSYIAIGKWK